MSKHFKSPVARSAALVSMLINVLAEATEQDQTNPSVLLKLGSLLEDNHARPKSVLGRSAPGMQRQVTEALFNPTIRENFGDWVCALLPESQVNSTEEYVFVLTRVTREAINHVDRMEESKNLCMMIDDAAADVNHYLFTPVAVTAPGGKKHKGIEVIIGGAPSESTFKSFRKAIRFAVNTDVINPDAMAEYLDKVAIRAGVEEYGLVQVAKKHGKKSASAVKTDAGWIEVITREVGGIKSSDDDKGIQVGGTVSVQTEQGINTALTDSFNVNQSVA